MTAIATTDPATASTRSAPQAPRTARARPPRAAPGTDKADQQHSPAPGGPLPAWPAGALDAAEHAFNLLISPPTPLTFDGRGVPGLPQRPIVLDELRHLLLAASTPRATRDRAWADLLHHARHEGPLWVLAIIGIALPALRHRAGLLSRGWHGDVADLDSELLLGFLERLNTIDPHAENLANRLVDARALKKARERSGERTEPLTSTGAQSIPPTWPWDHPDLVLARAVAAAVIGPEEGHLIALIRLEDVPLQQVADHLGITISTARAWRARAEKALRQAITAGDLHWLDLPGLANRWVPAASEPTNPTPTTGH
jgi:DNA-directed RNA polymerase specialized sigma24 family protein